VLHVNHGLRGEESRQDETFVRELASRLGLTIQVREAAIAGGKGNLEQAAREARLSFFREAIAEGVVDRVALGHTRTDQAETVLFRFLRGAGAAGLAGIRPVTSDAVVRPLLDVERPQILQFLHVRGIAWREDSSNSSRRFARNRIRHELLPQLARDWNPAIVETLAHAADWALAEEEYWETLPIFADFVEERGAILIRAARLRELPLAAARRVMRRAVERVKGDLRGVDFGHIAAILRLAQGSSGGGRVHAPGLEVRRSFDWLRLARRGAEPCPFQVEVTPPGLVRVPSAGFAISMQIIEGLQSVTSQDCVYNSEMGCLDGGLVSGALVLRNWRPGDHFQPVGVATEQKIKTLFQRARIPQWERGNGRS